MTETKFELAQLNAQTTVIDKLSVLSFEMNIYLVRLFIGQKQGLVFLTDSPQRFCSSQQIRDTFVDFKVLSAELLHQSPYDEMIANPPSMQENSTLPFSLRQPY